MAALGSTAKLPEVDLKPAAKVVPRAARATKVNRPRAFGLARELPVGHADRLTLTGWRSIL
jgi:hypothetical protein